MVLAGATGSLLAFHHEIDALLAPELHRVAPGAARASLDGIAARAEARHPGLVVGYFVFTPDPRASVRVVMNALEAAEAGRLDRDAARQTELYADPWSGEILGERRWGEAGATRAHLVPMLYRLHMSLFLGKAGQWITAAVGLFLVLSVCLGVVLALPRLALLGRAFAVKWRASRARTFFDLHRSVGLGASLLLLVSAFTGIYMNVPEVVEPAVAAISPFTARPPSVREAGAPRSRSWRVGWDAALASARKVEPRHHLAVFGRVEGRGYYQLRFMTPDDIVDAGTIRLFVAGGDGRVIGRFEDLEGSAGDLVRIWQFPLHSGQGFGLPGRIVVCVLGLVPLLLAGTGLWLWLRRRRLRASATVRGAARA